MSGPTPGTLIDVNEARRVLLREVHPGPVVRAPLTDALHRTLAEAVQTDMDAPPFDRALMDGYAVRSHDTATAPVSLSVLGSIPAGVVIERTLGPGEAFQINTGAPLPPGADAVVRGEDTALEGDRVRIHASVPPGQFITPRGSYLRAGDIVAAAGTLLTPGALSAVAAAGAIEVTTYRRPTVAIVSTGDELVEPGETLRPGQIRNSNALLLESLARASHVDVVALGRVADDRSALRERLSEALRHDVACVTGGVSMGAYDFVPGVLRDLGVAFHIEKMAIKPGRPTMFGTTEGRGLVFALPGNPVSAYVGFELLVRPALAMLQGRPCHSPMLVRATLVGKIGAGGARHAFIPARLRVNASGQWTAEATPWSGSGDVFGLVGAAGLISRPPGSPDVVDGNDVDVIVTQPDTVACR